MHPAAPSRKLVARLGLVALFVASAAIPVACGGNKPEANASFSFGGDGGAPAASQCAPGQPCPNAPPNCQPGQPCPAPSSSTAPMGSVYTQDPNALAQLLAAAAAAGSAFLAPMGGGDPAEAGLRAAQAKWAAGMTPEGQVAKGNLSEGGHVEFLVNMDPSKCYTVIGYGAGVQDLDLNLLAPPLYNILAGQDGMAGPTAVVGGMQKMCPIIPLSVPYKVDIHAKKGGGPVAAQLFSKPK